MTKKVMNRIVLWSIIGVVIIILVIIGVAISPMISFGSSTINPSSAQGKVVVTEQNFPAYLTSTNLVSDLPSDASILLKTEKTTYAVQKGSVSEGTLNNPDVVITIPSSYIPKISNGFCATMQEANNKGDLKLELNIGKTSAALKYRALYKYKSCLGV